MEYKAINNELEGIMDYQHDIMQECIGKIMLDIQEKKTNVIKERLKTLNIEIDFKHERERRFKLITCETSNELYSNETYYYNDGSKEGIRIVTFTETPPEYPNEFQRSEINIGFNYY